MVGIHHQGRFYEFVPWKGRICWEVAPWGCWRIVAEQRHHIAELVGSTDDAGVMVQVPTEDGLKFLCRDVTRGRLTLRLWERRGRSLMPVLVAESDQAGLEVGGRGWHETWRGGSTPERLQRLSARNP
jgi:tocopherol cyclase